MFWCGAAFVDWCQLKAELRGNSCDEQSLPEVRLPTLPQAATDFLSEVDAEDVRTDRLAAIIASDSGLSARLLRFVNSGAVGLRREIDDVAAAVRMLGLRPCRMFVSVAAAEAAVAGLKSSIFHGPTLASTHLLRALFAREVAVRTGADDGLAFSAGLLQDVLLPVIAEERVADYIAIISSDDGPPLPAAERLSLGWTHAEAAGSLLAGWGLPDNVVCCVWLHHDLPRVCADAELRQSAAYAVALSALLPDGYRQVSGGMATLLELSELDPRLDLDGVAARVDEQADRMLPAGAPRIGLARQIEAARRHRSAALSQAS